MTPFTRNTRRTLVLSIIISSNSSKFFGTKRHLLGLSLQLRIYFTVLYSSVIIPDDTEDTLSDRLLPIEHKTYKEVLRLFCEDKLTIKGRVVYIED